jgi:phage portal protein BeeE
MISRQMKGMLTVKKLDEARPAIQKLIDTLLEQRGHLTRENKQLSSQNTLLTDQRHKAIDQISRLFIEKDLMEREMYKKVRKLSAFIFRCPHLF